FVTRRGVVWFQAKGSGVEHEINSSRFWITQMNFRFRKSLSNFVSQSFDFSACPIYQKHFRNAAGVHFQRRSASSAAGSEEHDAAASGSEAKVFMQRAGDGLGVGIETVGADFARRICKFAQCMPVAGLASSFEADRVYSAPKFCRFIQHIYHIHGE